MNESAEDYIKTIYILMRRNACVHSVDIARELGFSRASVSAAMTNLRGKEIIVMKKNGEIKFTEKGERIAADIYEKHSTLSGFLQLVAGVDEQTAKDDACRMEHHISDSTYDGIKQYISKRSQS